ncbi:MAG TPA: DUF1905 domain-containing protein [Acidimicrobiaceae bacterium]|nr:DUF1905 domain-containing protein [Acidimicrobiaceae bacterium]
MVCTISNWCSLPQPRSHRNLPEVGRTVCPVSYEFSAEVWLHQGDAAWHFLTVPEEISDDIEERTSHLQRGFGSVRVRVRIGATTWATSVFPDTKRGAYILPVKKEVRRAEGIDDGTVTAVRLELVDV